MHPDDRDTTRAAFSHAFATGEPIARQQRIHQVGDGYHRHLVCHVPVRDVHELHELQECQGVLVSELQHRIRNPIAVVRGVADDTMDETGSTEAFRDALFDRLEVLSCVQGLLSRSEAGPITIGASVRLELDAVGTRALGDRVVAEGPNVYLRPSNVQTLVLALHELVTNARKYGALSHDGGRPTVTWRESDEDGEPRLDLDWVEAGLETARGRLAAPRTDGGYGRELLEQALPHAMGARTSYAFAL